MAEDQLFSTATVSFGPRFLQDHVGHIMTDPRIAIVELIANAYDAGASVVDVTWPFVADAEFSVADDGTGMTGEELDHRWKTLSYSRAAEQGAAVEFPPGVVRDRRVAFGQNGKGRFAPFCFSDSYMVETAKNGTLTRAKVSLSPGGSEPFSIRLLEQTPTEDHGTTIRGILRQEPLPVSLVSDAVGSKFLVDPAFSVKVNGRPLSLLTLKSAVATTLEVEGVGTITIHQINALAQDRTTLLRGITWWVNGRMVGTPAWDGLDGHGAILDGRTAQAKRLSFVVEAGVLKEHVKADWTAFHESDSWDAVRQAVRDFVVAALREAMSEAHRERKRDAIESNRSNIINLPSQSRHMLGNFIDRVQESCPSITPGDLSRTVEVFAKMEAARSGYALLEKLAACSPDDIDTWNRLMAEWSASAAETVLTELKHRLDLIGRLQKLVNAATTDELHELQPLFAQGLWIFGPEYESVEFTSNRALTTVIRTLLGGTVVEVGVRRPDFVALPDRSVSCFSADKYDAGGEVDGLRKLLILELKRGGFKVGTSELRQGEDYALAVENANGVGPQTEIVVYVLGSALADTASEDRRVGNKHIVPMTYDVILNRAHARTFNLHRKLEAAGVEVATDSEIEAILQESDLLSAGEQTGVCQS